MTIGLTQNLGIELGLGAGLLAILYGLYLISWILKQPAGNATMQAIAAAIQEGAMAFLRRQYTTVAIVAVSARDHHRHAARRRWAGKPRSVS